MMNLSCVNTISTLYETGSKNESTLNTERTVPPIVTTVFMGLVLGCIILATICGNVLVLLAVYVNSHLRSTTNYFIVNLAIADLLLGITVLPFSATLEALHYWPFGFAMCDIWASIDVLWCTASIMTLCVISIDRYIGVTRPLQHSSIITERKAFVIIICVWILSVAISIAPLVGWKEPPRPDSTECTVTKQVGYVIFSVSGSFYIPLLIIVIVYVRIYKEAMKHSRFLNSGIKTTKIDKKNGVVLRVHTGRQIQTHVTAHQSSSSSEHSEGSSRRKFSQRISLAGKIAKFQKEKKAAKTLGIVVGVFIVCWFPFFFCLPLDVLCESCHVPQQLFTVIFWLGYCNSLMNPIIYSLSSKEFKRAFIRILHCKFKRKPRLFLNADSVSLSEYRKWSRSLTELRKISTDYRPRVSFSGSQHSEEHVNATETDVSIYRRNSGSPMTSLRVLPNHRATFAVNASNKDMLDISEQPSSNSELADDENSDASSYLSDQRLRRAVIKVSSDSQIVGSFEKDENYINAFRNGKNQTVL